MDLEKNLLDLQHSLSQTKAALYLSLGIGGGIAIFFGGKQIGIGTLNSFITALFFSLPFIFYSMKNFDRCNRIQRRIYALMKNK